MVWAVHERDMSYLFFFMLLCQRVQGSLFLFFVFMSATKMNTHDLYEFYDFNIEVVLKSVNNSL